MATTRPGQSPTAPPRPPPAPGGSSPPQLLQRALARLLVLAPAHELRAVADAVARDVIEVHLDHELRTQALPDELLVRLPAARLAAAALAGPVGLEETDELALLLRLEARRVADHAQLAIVVVGAEDQRPKRALLL